MGLDIILKNIKSCDIGCGLMYTKDNIRELEELRLKLKENYNYGENVEIGDFTYGNPTVLSWEEGTKLEIGKFCSIASEVI
jgi:hypothetical protein